MSEFISINLGYKSDVDAAKALVMDLGDVFKKLGIEAIVEEPTSPDEHAWLSLHYDVEDVQRKFSRRAGKKERYLRLTPQEVRDRMAAGESAEAIAKKAGISRATLFRRLKTAEKNYFDEL